MGTGAATSSIPKYKRRTISAVRDFPPGCGPNAPRISVRNSFEFIENDDHELPQSKDSEIVEVGFDEACISSYMSSMNLNRKFPQRRKVSAIRDFPPLCGTDVSRAERKKSLENLCAEISDEDGSSKEIMVYLEACQSRGTRMSISEMSEFSSEHRVGNVSVHSPSAAPNYPWRQRKGDNVTCNSSFQKTRGLKLKHGSGSGTKKSNIKKLFEERRAMKAGSTNWKASSNYIDPAPSRSSNPYETAIEGDVGPSMHEIFLSPLVPENTVMQKNSYDRVAYNKVTEALSRFKALYNELTRENEANVRKGGPNRKRIDQVTAKILKEEGKFVNTEKLVGSVPGVDIGLEFHFREELRVVGLHRPTQAGIDFMKRDGTVIATSIVASGGYDDDMDGADVLNYSGSGGNPSKGDTTFEDQKLQSGNLALRNSIAAANPVRVIRGHDHKITGARTVKKYTYDGLYSVTKYWQEQGPNGNLVYMFRLERIPGQPEICWNSIKKSKVRRGVCMSDISQGKERMPICAVNTVDGQKPPMFKYITNMLYPDWFRMLPLRGCECVKGCSNSEGCLCAVRNGGLIPFNNNGCIVEAKPLVYECGPSCKCPPSCSIRVSQSGIKFQLEIFRTESRGWGVRSLNLIPSGSFICEYLGELLEDKQAEQRIGSDEYLFDIGQNLSDEYLSDKLANSKPHLRIAPSEVVEDIGYSVDANRYGNIGRFINHSCSPNLYAQNVLYDHEDRRMPHIMFFATKNISPMQELAFHYNYKIGEVHDANGNVKTKRCFCGSANCSGRLY